MNHFASAYARALFPRRYGSRGGTSPDTAPHGDAPAALPPGSLELDLAAAVYRLTGVVERLADSLRRRHADRRNRAGHRPVRRPLECG